MHTYPHHKREHDLASDKHEAGHVQLSTAVQEDGARTVVPVARP